MLQAYSQSNVYYAKHRNTATLSTRAHLPPEPAQKP